MPSTDSELITMDEHAAQIAMGHFVEQAWLGFDWYQYLLTLRDV
jgi:hypothetical protein